MILEPYTRKHLDSLQPGPYDAASAFHLKYEQGWDEKAVSAREDGRTLGICGIAVVRGRAHVWLVLSDEIRTRAVALSRMAKTTLEHLGDSYDAVEVEVDPKFTQARKWAAWLGFVPEGERTMVWRQQQAR